MYFCLYVWCLVHDVLALHMHVFNTKTHYFSSIDIDGYFIYRGPDGLLDFDSVKLYLYKDDKNVGLYKTHRMFFS